MATSEADSSYANRIATVLTNNASCLSQYFLNIVEKVLIPLAEFFPIIHFSHVTGEIICQRKYLKIFF